MEFIKKNAPIVVTGAIALILVLGVGVFLSTKVHKLNSADVASILSQTYTSSSVSENVNDVLNLSTHKDQIGGISAHTSSHTVSNQESGEESREESNAESEAQSVQTSSEGVVSKAPTVSKVTATSKPVAQSKPSYSSEDTTSEDTTSEDTSADDTTTEETVSSVPTSDVVSTETSKDENEDPAVSSDISSETLSEASSEASSDTSSDTSSEATSSEESYSEIVEYIRTNSQKIMGSLEKTVNNYRHDKGLPKVKRNTYLDSVAQARAIDISERYICGENTGELAEFFHYDYVAMNESIFKTNDISSGVDYASLAYKAWSVDGTTDKLAIDNKHFKDIGIGIYTANNYVYMVLILGDSE